MFRLIIQDIGALDDAKQDDNLASSSNSEDQFKDAENPTFKVKDSKDPKITTPKTPCTSKATSRRTRASKLTCETCEDTNKPIGYIQKGRSWWCKSCLELPRVMRCSFKKSCINESIARITSSKTWTCESCLKEKKRKRRLNNERLIGVGITSSEASDGKEGRREDKAGERSGDSNETRKKKEIESVSESTPEIPSLHDLWGCHQRQ